MGKKIKAKAKTKKAKTKKALNICQKVNKVMEEVEKVKKTGYNEFNKYEYATEEDILKEVRPMLIKYRLIILPSIFEEKRENDLTTLRFNFRIIDIDSRDEIKLSWIGYGSDKQDKGGYKAMTGAVKFFLSKTFLLPSGNDPEEERKAKAQDNLKKEQITETIKRIRETKDKATLLKWQTGIGASKTYTEPQKRILLGAIEESLKTLK